VRGGHDVAFYLRPVVRSRSISCWAADNLHRQQTICISATPFTPLGADRRYPRHIRRLHRSHVCRCLTIGASKSSA
jgi:hypothetical protein